MRWRKQLGQRVSDDYREHRSVAVEFILLFVIVFFILVVVVLELEQQLVGQCGHRRGGLRSDLSDLQW